MSNAKKENLDRENDIFSETGLQMPQRGTGFRLQKSTSLSETKGPGGVPRN